MSCTTVADSLRNNLLDLKDNETLPYRKTLIPKAKAYAGVIKNEVKGRKETASSIMNKMQMARGWRKYLLCRGLKMAS